MPSFAQTTEKTNQREEGCEVKGTHVVLFYETRTTDGSANSCQQAFTFLTLRRFMFPVLDLCESSVLEPIE